MGKGLGRRVGVGVGWVANKNDQKSCVCGGFLWSSLVRIGAGWSRISKSFGFVVVSCGSPITDPHHYTQYLESDRYDQQTHERLTKAAFDHCEAYSAEVEAQVSNGEGSSSQAAASPPPATPTKARKKPLKPKTPVKPKAASRRTPQPTEPAPLVVDLMALVGTTVKQSFDGVWYNAKVSFVNVSRNGGAVHHIGG